MENDGMVTGDTITVNLDYSFKILMPLEMIWQPKEDITTYELAMCIPYLFRNCGIMPYEVDRSLPHFRHFEIIDHNE